MRITALETFRSPEQPNVCFVRLTDESGATGLGEAFFHAGSVDAFLHESVAPLLLAHEDPTPHRVCELLRPYVGFQGGGVENRARGAVDVALWDLVAKRYGVPLAVLLGGPVRDAVPVYNTCAGTRYVGSSGWQSSANWNPQPGTFEDLWAFLHEPAALARSLLDSGITGMKIWPFDTYAELSGGHTLSRRDLMTGVDIVRAIRDEVGDAMDVMIELHGLWSVGPAVQIATALEDLGIRWLEDPVRADLPAGLAEVRSATSIPIASGETVVGPRGFAALLERSAIDIATVDLQWTGGLSEAIRVAAVCEAAGVPIAPHDCTGPVTLATSVHLTTATPNGLIQETARAFIHSWYRTMVAGLPEIVDGRISPSGAPGHGVTLMPAFEQAPGTSRRLTSAGG